MIPAPILPTVLLDLVLTVVTVVTTVMGVLS